MVACDRLPSRASSAGFYILAGRTVELTGFGGAAVSPAIHRLKLMLGFYIPGALWGRLGTCGRLVIGLTHH